MDNSSVPPPPLCFHSHPPHTHTPSHNPPYYHKAKNKTKKKQTNQFQTACVVFFVLVKFSFVLMHRPKVRGSTSSSLFWGGLFFSWRRSGAPFFALLFRREEKSILCLEKTPNFPRPHFIGTNLVVAGPGLHILFFLPSVLNLCECAGFFFIPHPNSPQLLLRGERE